jgi:hypothetical protein
VLLISEEEWSDHRVRTVWKVLIASSPNGYLNAGKFLTLTLT